MNILCKIFDFSDQKYRSSLSSYWFLTENKHCVWRYDTDHKTDKQNKMDDNYYFSEEACMLDNDLMTVDEQWAYLVEKSASKDKEKITRQYGFCNKMSSKLAHKYFKRLTTT